MVVKGTRTTVGGDSLAPGVGGEEVVGVEGCGVLDSVGLGIRAVGAGWSASCWGWEGDPPRGVASIS